MFIANTQYTLKYMSFEIYVSGCYEPHCKDCHNPELWDFKVGREFNEEVRKELRESILFGDELIKRIWILGGEPLDQDKNDFQELIDFAKNFNKELWLFTKYPLRVIPEYIRQNFDFIKSGRYIKECLEKNIQYGVELSSSNQIIYKKDLDY